MAQAAVVETASNFLLPGAANSGMTKKRKTPSELRGEQLKRRNAQVIGEKDLPPLLASDSVKSTATRRSEQLKIPRYITTRVNEVYPVKKSSERCRGFNGDEKAKVSSSVSGFSNDVPSPAASLPAEGKPSILENPSLINKSEGSDQSTRDTSEQGFRTIEKCSQNVLRNVVQLHMGDENLANCAKIDMEKALRGLVSREIPSTSVSLAVSSGKVGGFPTNSSSNSFSEFEMPGSRVPFDFTLKTTLRFISSSSVKWCHRLCANPAVIGISCNPHSGGQNLGCASVNTTTTEVKYSKSLHSWVYPQNSLPASVMSMFVSSAAKGDSNFLLKRQQDWEDSFRDLYYMLRKNICNIFYVCTMQFVVLFIGGKFLGKKRHSCNAYLSQSTRGLRSLLREHSVSFAMPLCHAEVEQAAEDDLVELMEIEKRNLGQAFHVESLSDVDNTPQSLLSFIGNKQVHALCFLNSFNGCDVPVLHAPVPFLNASFHVPEVRCKEIRKADMVIPSSCGSDTEDFETMPGSSARGLCYSIEIKDTVVPPWIVCGICAAMSSDGRSFESIFATEPTSAGLNVALDTICCDSDDDALGIPDAVLTPRLGGATLRRLKYTDGAFVANVTPI
ncbi:downstream neighbor of Son [Musa troglodytarum]|uniref:Downstream neighbor of Son n=1 Tax=Musa troglodytarum TaxID=320322 RepID=A0A9E7JWF4_9LILI|nr:downstream neighbor of Son [Musa troglodytarum]